ncbi:MAG: cupredoxin domain-containing protein [Chloroflexi bacterium]|nr:cupredoxin domain-containing protein [Chloroflexota bacterium]MBI3760484.1 cupredoxin domain-containing protein [Chloroflexota bacterium]
MRRQSAILAVVILAVAALSLAACGGKAAGGPTEVHVKLTEFKVEMDKTSIPAGPVKFIIDNAGKEKHEVVLEPAGINDVPFEVNGKASEAEDIEAGKSATLEWTIDKPGQYQLACHITENNEDHYANGMVTTFTVAAP